jgi:hypothetical protein
MRTHAWMGRILLLSMMLASEIAAAQDNVAGSVMRPVPPSGALVIGGAAFAVAHINCQLCEQEFPYRRAASVLGSVGYRVNRRVNVAGEVFWIPTPPFTLRGIARPRPQIRPSPSQCVRAGSCTTGRLNSLDQKTNGSTGWESTRVCGTLSLRACRSRADTSRLRSRVIGVLDRRWCRRRQP